MARPVLLYDTGCRLCRFAARIVARLDRCGDLALLGLDDASGRSAARGRLRGRARQIDPARPSRRAHDLGRGGRAGRPRAAAGNADRLHDRLRRLARCLRPRRSMPSSLGTAPTSACSCRMAPLRGATPDHVASRVTRCRPDVDAAVRRVAVDLGQLLGGEVERDRARRRSSRAGRRCLLR